jgi:D-alanyl-D-alanine carboxypeptidase (penicillin-binding protein 5/6)
VAGESPGKAEQRQSSGETTRAKGDPRLAVFRESAVAADRDTESSARAGTESDTDRGASPESGAGTEAEAGTGSGKGPGTEPEAASTGVATAKPGDDPEGSEEPEQPRKPDAVADGTDSVEPPAADADTDADTDEPSGDEERAEPSEPTEPSESSEPDSAKDTPDAKVTEAAEDAKDAKAAPPAEGRKAPSWAAAPADAPKDAKSPSADTDSDDGGADDSGSDGSDDRPQVDSPTTTLKARPRPVVDRPTTALKKPKASELDAGRGTGTAADADRGSTFVPLRRDDTPSAFGAGFGTTTAPKPEPSVPAPATVPAPASLSGAERTRQQPMPPKPPLDLLAELTNTPPPRETPVRTTVRRVKIWTPLVLLLLIVFGVVQVLRPLPAPTLAGSGSPTFTFDGDTLAMPFPTEGQGAVEVDGVGTIGTYGPQKPAPIASVAKTMTAYVILKAHPITGNQNGPKITVDKQAGDESNRPDESTAPIKEGQQYTERQMLQLLMIPSGNNAARLLARWDAGAEPAFVKKMNDAAKQLGMAHTTYTDPSGLTPTTVSTPVDQLKLAKAVMANSVFRDIVNTPQAEIPGIDKTIYNNNSILLQDGVSGIKTGSSTPAGGNLLWAANTVVDGKDRRVVGMVMGIQNASLLSQKLELANQDSLKLIKAAQAGVTSGTIAKKGQVVGYVDDGLGTRTPVVVTKDLKAVGWGGLKVRLDFTDNGKSLPHSAKAGTVVGSMSVGRGSGQVAVPVALQKALAEPGFGAKLGNF